MGIHGTAIGLHGMILYSIPCNKLPGMALRRGIGQWDYHGKVSDYSMVPWKGPFRAIQR